MITNEFNANNLLVGFKIEMIDKNFVVAVAVRKQNNWQAKMLGGFSGDLKDSVLISHVMLNGYLLDEETASHMFPNVAEILKYST